MSLGLKTGRGATENNLVSKPPHHLSTTGWPGHSPGMLEGTERRGLMCEASDPGVRRRPTHPFPWQRTDPATLAVSGLRVSDPAESWEYSALWERRATALCVVHPSLHLQAPEAAPGWELRQDGCCPSTGGISHEGQHVTERLNGRLALPLLPTLSQGLCNTTKSHHSNYVGTGFLRVHGEGRVYVSKAEEPWPQVPQGLVSP